MTGNQEVYRDVLGEGYGLHWYEVQSVLGRGAFGVTYLARDKNLDQLVAIKEYFPRDFSSRASGHTVQPTTGEKQELYEWGLVRFVREAQTLAKFKHHNIVRVMSVFELNNTAYMVMEYEQGEELSKVYKRKGKFSEQELLDIFIPIMDGLKLVHDAGFIHRDIKPSNIFIRADGSPVLIDFGAARQTIGTPTRTVTSLVTYGYAPFEQYNESDDKQGAWTDIYALGACLYLAVTGKLPVDALARGSSLLSNGIDPYEPASTLKESQFSPGFLRAIDYALMFRATDRPQDILAWADMLSGKVEPPPLETALAQPPNGVADEDATVIMTTPPGVSDLHARPSHPVTMPATGTPAITPRTIPPTTPSAPSVARSTATTTTPEQQVGRDKGRKNVNLIASGIIVLSLIAAGGIFVFWQKGEVTTETESKPADQAVEQVEQTVDVESQNQLATLTDSAAKAYDAGKLLDKEGGAIYLYQQILNIDPANPEATRRIEEIIDLSTDGIRSDLAEGFDNKAQRKLQLLKDAAPTSAAVLTLVKELEKIQTKQADVSKLVKQAKSDFKAGRIITPRNNNALSKYRQILTIEPGNADAKRGIENISEHYEELAEKNLARGRISQAERNIDDLLFVDSSSTAAKQLSRKLESLKSRNQQQQDITRLLARAQRAVNVGNLITPVNKNALSLYRQVLELEKNNSKAKQGILQVEKNLQSRFDKYLAAGDFTSAQSTLRDIESVLPNTRLARDVRAQWERNKPADRPDIEIINEMIGKFKQSFESRNTKALASMSEYQANRQAFLQQLFSNYTSFKINIADIKFIGRERKGTANISLTNLVNIQGAAVQPGTWSRFQIVIRKNDRGQWKIFW